MITSSLATTSKSLQKQIYDIEHADILYHQSNEMLLRGLDKAQSKAARLQDQLEALYQSGESIAKIHHSSVQVSNPVFVDISEVTSSKLF